MDLRWIGLIWDGFLFDLMDGFGMDWYFVATISFDKLKN